MSFLDKLQKAIKIIKDVKDTVDSVKGDSAPKPASAPSSEQPSVVKQSPMATTYNTDDAHFASIITKEAFAEYDIETNVHASRFDAEAHPKCYPISYLFSKDSQPVLAVLVMNLNQRASMIATGTYNVLDDNGIRYIRFYKGMENEQGYVINRIKDNL